MRKIHLLAGLATVCLFFVISAAASAEFASHNKKTEGGSRYSVLKLEAGGATVQCLGQESTSAPTWKIKNEKGEAAESGPKLSLKTKTWGECGVEAKGIKESSEATVSSDECELEVQQPHEEETTAATFSGACTAKIEVSKEVCEVKIEPKELKSVTVDDSGVESENMIVNLALKNVVTSTKGAGCEHDSIKSTKEGLMEGEIEVTDASIKAPGAPFSVYLQSGPIVTNGQTATIAVKWLFPAREPATPLGALQARETPLEATPYFTIGGETWPTCQNKEYNITQPECKMKVKMERTPPRGLYLHHMTIWATWLGQTSEETVIGVR